MKVNLGIITTLALAFLAGVMGYGELRQQVKDLREVVQIEMSHAQSWIDDLRDQVRELQKR